MEMQSNTFTGPGIYADMPNEEYHRIAAVGSSGLKEAIYTAATYQKNYLSQEALEADESETVATRMGSALHCLVLEPAEFAKRFVTVPEDAPKKPSVTQRNAKNPSADTVTAIMWWDKFAMANAGATILPPEEMAAVVKGAKIVYAHAVARGILTTGKAEVSYFAHDPKTGLLQKSRPDWTVDNGDDTVDMADLKTTGKPYMLTVDRWKNACRSQGYFIQASHHGDVLEQATAAAGRRVKVANNLHIVYSFADELCRVFRIPEAHLDMGRSRADEGRARIAEGMETGVWPGFAEEVTDLPVSTYDGTELE